MDPADIANDTLEVCQADALRRQLGSSAPETHPDFDGTHCVNDDCGIVIPAKRLALGRVRCVDCQGALERSRAMRLHNIRA